MGVDDEYISDTQPFLKTKSCQEKNMTDSRGSQNDELTLMPISASTATAHNAPRQKDAGWAIAFKVNVGITVICAVCFGRTGLTDSAVGVFFEGRRLEYQDENLSWLLYALVACSVIVSWALSWALLKMVIKFPWFVMKAWHLYWGALCCMLAVIGWFTDFVYLTVLGTALGGVALYFFFRRRSRTRFGAANLKVAAVAVHSMPQAVVASLCVAGVRLTWCAVTIVAGAGSTHAFRSVEALDGTYYPATACRDVISSVGPGSTFCECNGEPVSSDSVCQYSKQSAGLVFFWCLSFVWGARVINNVITATVAGSVASWWFSPNDVAPVRGALYRATHASFGSLCKAAAISGVVHLLREVVNRLVRVVCCLRFLLSWFQNAVDYVLNYVVTFIGIYGLDFKEASSRVGELFRTRGITALANDTGILLGLGALGVFVMSLSSVALYCLLLLSPVATTTGPEVWPLLAAGHIIYFTSIFTVMDVVYASFKTVFVCFVQDSEALAANHDRQYHSELSKAWEEMNVLSLTDGVRGEYQA